MDSSLILHIEMTINFENFIPLEDLKIINMNSSIKNLGIGSVQHNDIKYYFCIVIDYKTFMIKDSKFSHDKNGCYEDSILFSNIAEQIQRVSIFDFINNFDELLVKKEIAVDLEEKSIDCFHCSPKIAIEGAITEVKRKMNIC
jgi:hypothetical protein